MKTKPEPLQQEQAAWGPVSALLVTVGAFFGGQILGVITFVLGLSIFSRSPLQAALDTLSHAGTAYQFYSILLIEAFTVGLLYVFLRFRKAKLRDLGFSAGKLSDILAALIGYGAYFMLYLLTVTIAGALIPSLNLDQEQQIGFDRAAHGFSLVPIFISLVVLPAVVEELLMRGFLYKGLRTKLTFMWSVIVTSILFAVAHLQWGSDAPLLWVAAIDTFLLSVVLCYLREKTGRLWAPIMLHGLKNFIAFLVLFVFRIG